MSSAEASDRGQDSWLTRIKSALGLSEPSSLREGLEDALQEHDATADITLGERALLINVLKMRDVRVSDIMVPRVHILAVSEDISLAELIAAFQSSEHARMPVYGETLDDARGMVHIRDLFRVLAGSPGAAPFSELGSHDRPLRQAGLLRPLLFVPPSTPALDLLVRMQAKRLHMALVIDEYGETDGLVTMEDLVEVIVGDINDEHDSPEPAPIVRLPDNTLAVAGDAAREDVEAALGLPLATEMPGAEPGSIGGYVASLAGRVPQAGETIAGPSGLLFEVVEAGPRQILRLSIRMPGLPGDIDGVRQAIDRPAGT